MDRLKTQAETAFNNVIDFARISKGEIEISGNYYRGIYYLSFALRGSNGKIYSTTNVIVGC